MHQNNVFFYFFKSAHQKDSKTLEKINLKILNFNKKYITLQPLTFSMVIVKPQSLKMT
jgi:hypothetical protein